MSAVLFLLTISSASAVAQAQQLPAPPPSETEASYRRAHTVLDAAAKALAGEKALPGMDAISFKISGKLMHRNQSLRADGPPDGTPFAAEVAVDFAPVEQVIGVHSQPTSMAKFAKLMDLRRQRAAQ